MSDPAYTCGANTIAGSAVKPGTGVGWNAVADHSALGSKKMSWCPAAAGADRVDCLLVERAEERQIGHEEARVRLVEQVVAGNDRVAGEGGADATPRGREARLDADAAGAERST